MICARKNLMIPSIFYDAYIIRVIKNTMEAVNFCRTRRAVSICTNNFKFCLDRIVYGLRQNFCSCCKYPTANHAGFSPHYLRFLWIILFTVIINIPKSAFAESDSSFADRFGFYFGALGGMNTVPFWTTVGNVFALPGAIHGENNFLPYRMPSMTAGFVAGVNVPWFRFEYEYGHTWSSRADFHAHIINAYIKTGNYGFYIGKGMGIIETTWQRNPDRRGTNINQFIMGVRLGESFEMPIFIDIEYRIMVATFESHRIREPFPNHQHIIPSWHYVWRTEIRLKLGLQF